MEIGSRLKALRKERKETQLQVAQAIGMGDRHYQRIENDEGLPGLEIFCALAEHFGVSLDYLAGRTDRRERGAVTPVMETPRLLLRPFRAGGRGGPVRLFARDPRVGRDRRLAAPPAAWRRAGSSSRTVFCRARTCSPWCCGRAAVWPWAPSDCVGGHPGGGAPGLPGRRGGVRPVGPALWGRGPGAGGRGEPCWRYGFAVAGPGGGSGAATARGQLAQSARVIHQVRLSATALCPGGACGGLRPRTG